MIQKETENKSSEEYKSKHDIEFQLSCLLIYLIEHFSTNWITCMKVKYGNITTSAAM